MAKKTIDESAIGNPKLNFTEKIRLLSERYRLQGFVFCDLLGISNVSLSRIANFQAPLSADLRTKIWDLSCGLITKADLALVPEPKKPGRRAPAAAQPEPAKPEPKKPEAPVAPVVVVAPGEAPKRVVGKPAVKKPEPKKPEAKKPEPKKPLKKPAAPVPDSDDDLDI